MIMPTGQKENQMKIEIIESSAYVYTPYNANFVTRIKTVGGAKWDGAKKAWKVPANTVDEVRAIMREIYGETDEPEAVEKVNVRLTFISEFSPLRAPVTLLGKTIATAYGRDSGARVGSGVTFINKSPESGGSVKNWHTVIPEGSVCVLHDVPASLVTADNLPECVSFEIEARRPEIERIDLIAERERLLARIAEIDKLLAE